MIYIPVPYSKRYLYFDEQEHNKFTIREKVKALGIHPFLFPDAFYEHLETEKRYSVWVGGNGSSKSTTKARYFIMKCLQGEYKRILYLRHNFADIKNSMFLMLKGVIQKEGLDDKFKIMESTYDIICIENGNMLVPAGLDNTGKLSGLDDFTDIWFEEPITRSDGRIRMISHEQFEDLDSRLRMPHAKLTMHMTLNPISKQFFVYADMLNPELKPEERKYDINDWDVCNTNYLDNPFLPESYIKLVLGFQGDRAIYGRLGEWCDETTGNEWIPNFNRALHVGHVPYISDLPICSGFDFNRLPYQTNILVQFYRKKNGKLQIRVFKEYCLEPPLNEPENACKFLIKEYLEPFGFNTVRMFGDASGKFGYDNYRGLEVILTRYLHRGHDCVFKRNPPIFLARDLINDFFGGAYNVEILIDESCKNLILDLSTMQTTADGFDNERTKGVEQKGHCYSAFSYIVCKEYEGLMKHNLRK